MVERPKILDLGAEMVEKSKVLRIGCRDIKRFGI